MHCSKLSACGTILQVLQTISEFRCMPIGVQGTLYAAVDQLRAAQVPDEYLSWAETVAVTVHQLEWAIRHRQAEQEAEHRKELILLAQDWVEQQGALMLKPQPRAPKFVPPVEIPAEAPKTAICNFEEPSPPTRAKGLMGYLSSLRAQTRLAVIGS